MTHLRVMLKGHPDSSPTGGQAGVDMGALVTCHKTHSKTRFRLLGNAPIPSQNAGSTSTEPAASGFDTAMLCEVHGGGDDDVDSEKLSPSSSAKEASASHRESPEMKTWCRWRLCCALGMISAIALVGGTAVL